MFTGEYQHAIDNKGRVIIPSRFRDELGTSFMVTKGLEDCLFVYSFEEWKNASAQIRQLSFTKSDARSFSRIFFSGACEVELDKQGRILLPANLRLYAGLDKDIYIIGVMSRVEIWDKEKWLSYSEATAAAYGDIAERINDLDF